MENNNDINYGADMNNTNINVDDMSESEALTLYKKISNKLSTGWSAVVRSDQAANIVTSSKLVAEQEAGKLFINYMYKTGMLIAPSPLVNFVGANPRAELGLKFIIGAASSSLLTYGRHQVSSKNSWLIGPLERGCMHAGMAYLPQAFSLDDLLSRVFGGMDAQIVMDKLRQAEELEAISKK